MKRKHLPSSATPDYDPDMPAPERIESPQNPRVKSLAKIRSARGRSPDGRFLIDGIRENLRAIVSGCGLESLVICRERLQVADYEMLVQVAAERAIPILEVGPQAFAKIAFGQREEGVVGIAIVQRTALDQWAQPALRSIYLIVEGIEKPGNLGAIFRTADAAGIAGLLLTPSSASPENANAIRASLGTVFTIPYAIASAAEILTWLNQHNVRVFAARVQASIDYWDVEYFLPDSPAPSRQGEAAAAPTSGCSPVALAVGSEAEGLSSIWQESGITGIRIPQYGIADSLNLSVAAGVVIYEMARQLNRGTPRTSP